MTLGQVDLAMRRLADVLERENLALKAMDLRGAAALLAEKTAAMADLGALASKQSGPAETELASIARRLDGIARENRRLLERAIAVQQRVIGIVVRAAASAAVKPSYGAVGRPERMTAPLTLSTRA